MTSPCSGGARMARVSTDEVFAILSEYETLQTCVDEAIADLLATRRPFDFEAVCEEAWAGDIVKPIATLRLAEMERGGLIDRVATSHDCSCGLPHGIRPTYMWRAA